MAYSEKARQYAFDTVEQRRISSAEKSAEKKARLLKEIPELQALEYEIASIGVSAARAMITESNDDIKKALSSQLDELKAKQVAILKKNGFTPDALAPVHVCEKCCDTGATPDGRLCECVEKLLRDYSFAEIKKVSPLALSRFDAFSLDYYSTKKDAEFGNSPRAEMETNLKICKAFAEQFPNCKKSLLLLGDAGLGKTHLALSIASRVIERGYDVIYCSASSVLKQIEIEYFEEHRSTETIDSLIACSLLVLDDIGAEYNSAYVKSSLYNIINTRVIENRPTIFTTNFLKQDALISRYGEKITSRLLGCCSLLPFYGEDVRIIRNNE